LAQVCNTNMWLSYILRAFTWSRRAPINFANVRPYVHKYKRCPHWADFHEILYWGKITKISIRSPYLVDIWYYGLYSCNIVGSDTCSTTVQRTHCCASVVRLSTVITLLTATYVRQHYQYNALLPLHGNNGYTKASHCHVISYIAYTIQINMDMTAFHMNGTVICSNVPSFNTWSVLM
jgi:hypothetical protein